MATDPKEFASTSEIFVDHVQLEKCGLTQRDADCFPPRFSIIPTADGAAIVYPDPIQKQTEFNRHVSQKIKETCAAGGDQAAYNEIYNAAQELTGGLFEQHFKHGQQMFSNITRVPLGFYRLGDTLRDLRDIDYTAVANIFANNPMQIHAYSDTFVDRPGCGSIQNLSIRENLISEALNGAIDITSYAARVSLSMDFITALSLSIASTKLPVTVNTPLSADMLCTGTAAPNFIGQALARGTQTSARAMHNSSASNRTSSIVTVRSSVVKSDCELGGRSPASVL